MSSKPKEASLTDSTSSTVMGVLLSCHKPAFSQVASMPAPCILCSEALSPADVEYPMQCASTACQFNACLNCARQMKDSIQNGMQQASDGNVYHLRLDRNCPDCRGTFLVAIKDVILLREERLQSQGQKKRLGVRDSELSAKELRVKYRFSGNRKEHEEQVILARHRFENRIFDPCTEGKHTSLSLVATTAHRSPSKIDQRIAYIDSKLYAGWEHAMSIEELDYVKCLLTSGNTDQLAQAAEILASISHMNQSALPPAVVSTSPFNITSSSKPSLKKNNSCSFGSRSSASFSRSVTSDLQREFANRRKLETLYPFPVRMPRSIVLPLDFNPYDPNASMTFMDDESFYEDWNNAQKLGNSARETTQKLMEVWVTDAYHRLTFNFWNDLVRTPTASIGLRNIIRGAKSIPPLNPNANATVLDPMPWRRVVVSSVKGPLASIGVRVGDVITHLEGERFRGNSDTMKACLEKRRREGRNEGFSSGCLIVLNAEPGTAYALRILSHLAATAMEQEEDVNLL